MSNTFYMRDRLGNVGTAMIIPTEDAQPDWLKKCNLSYREDGTSASICQGTGLTTGRIGCDIVVCWGDSKKNGGPMVDIIYKGTETYRGVQRCNADGTDL